MVTSVVYGRIGWSSAALHQRGKPDDVIRRIRNRAFSLVENITKVTWKSRALRSRPIPATTLPQEAKYRELAQNKLAHLRNARLLATDPSMMFKLDQEIAELEKLLG
jgi:hypothetical protein